jgi:hypothetical protein
MNYKYTIVVEVEADDDEAALDQLEKILVDWHFDYSVEH